MAITTYSELQNAIVDWLNKPDLSQLAADFIALVEADLNSRLRCREQIIRARTTSNAEFVDVPGNWVEAINLHIVGGQQPLRYVTLDQADIFNGEQTYTSPHFYSLMNGAIEIIPAPAENIEIEMIYYAKITPLSNASPTNWLLTKAPDVYLYGALSHAAPLLMEDQRVPMFTQFYNTRVQSLLDESQKSLHSGSPLIARTRRVY